MLKASRQKTEENLQILATYVVRLMHLAFPNSTDNTALTIFLKLVRGKVSDVRTHLTYCFLTRAHYKRLFCQEAEIGTSICEEIRVREISFTGEKDTFG
ncbi:hypothetical protein NPIL_201541 [Nephila pilipes]|uniref:Uncharacterized protein n=1 Tax=Nephila pilipes TaxID=299642 RepID=A0A8X6ID10_NEPPI|nr:hypothetical protein NPIL_201541 [Nephila pilipes]